MSIQGCNALPIYKGLIPGLWQDMFNPFVNVLSLIVLTVYGYKYMWTSQYVRSRTGRLLLERLAEEENHHQETDATSVSNRMMQLTFLFPKKLYLQVRAVI